MSSELTPYEEKTLANVERWGCHITTVFDPDSSDPPFSYSAGLEETFGSGEVIIVGLDASLMGSIINSVADQLEGGLILTDNARLKDLLAGFDMIAKAIPAECIVRDTFNTAMWLHQRKTGRPLTNAFQLVWPDAGPGLFPWEPNCPTKVVVLQPLLYGVVSSSES